jgi:hypothetical protein
MLRRGAPAFRCAVNRVLARLYRSGQILKVYSYQFARLGMPGALLFGLYAIEGMLGELQGAVCRSCYTSRTLPMGDEAR